MSFSCFPSSRAALSLQQGCAAAFVSFAPLRLMRRWGRGAASTVPASARGRSLGGRPSAQGPQGSRGGVNQVVAHPGIAPEWTKRCNFCTPTHGEHCLPSAPVGSGKGGRAPWRKRTVHKNTKARSLAHKQLQNDW